MEVIVFLKNIKNIKNIFNKKGGGMFCFKTIYLTVFLLGLIGVTIDAKLKNHKATKICRINHENLEVVNKKYCIATEHTKCCEEPKIKMRNSKVTRIENIAIDLIQSNNVNTVKITKDNKVVNIELKPNITKANIIAIVKSNGIDIDDTLADTLADTLLNLPSMIDNSPDDGKD